MPKRWILKNTDEIAAQSLADELRINPVLCQLLVQRGVRTYAEAKSFFRPSLDDLHDPFVMRDMDKAVTRLHTAITQQQKVLLYGDYDVDGTTSVALLYDFLQPYLTRLDYYIPDRYKEGYGVSMASIDYAKQNGFQLIIAMDCGIKAVAPIALANQYGIDFIVCDHHVPDAVLPAAHAILDPKRPDCPYPFKELCGCGIAFKLAQAYLQHLDISVHSLERLLDLCAVSIACDLVSMTGENRILAHFGLLRLNENPRVGFRALMRVREKEHPLNINDIVFGLGPLINAAGRLSDAKLAVRLLIAQDPAVAKDAAEQLSQQNKLRREVEADIMVEVAAQMAANTNEMRKSVVLYSPKWHKGIVGIIAARISEQVYRPTVVLTESEGKIVGSVRTVAGFDVYEALRQCEDLLDNFGGHAFAAGLVMLPENLETFTIRFELLAQQLLTPELLIPEVNISAVLPLAHISERFYGILRQFAPFGPGNMRPVFLATDLHEPGFSRLSRNEQHLLLSLPQPNGSYIHGVAFGMGHLYTELRRQAFDMCYVLDEIVTQNGELTVRFQVKDFRIKL